MGSRFEDPVTRGKRLANEGRVKHDDGAEVYYIQSDSGQTYTMIVSGTGNPSCNCAATGMCAHLYALARSRVREKMGA
jgi:hypothetical protein